MIRVVTFGFFIAKISNIVELDLEKVIKPLCIQGLHVILLDAPALGYELRMRQLGYHFEALPSVCQKEQELVNKELVVRVFIIRVRHALLLFEILLHSSDVLLEVLPLFLLALKHAPILLNPRLYELLARGLVD
jgi:hypothetical protein